MNLISLLKSRKTYFIGYFLFVISVTVLLVTNSKHEGHLLVNSFHTPTLDLFFARVTHLGDGITVVIIGVVFLLLQIRKGLIFLLAGALSGMVTQFFKRIVFSHENYRPTKFFELNHPDIHLPLVEGIDMHSNFSFPSGHTTAAFAMMTSAALLSRNKYADALFIIAAAIISFSRVYISQHFLEDILAGSFVGTLFAIFIYLFFNMNKFADIAWLNKKILPSKARKNKFFKR